MTNYIYRIKEFSNCSKQRKSSKTKTLYWTRNNLGWSKMKTNKLPGDQLAAKFPSFYSSAPLLLACRNPTKGLVSSLESPSLALGVIRIKQNNQPKIREVLTMLLFFSVFFGKIFVVNFRVPNLMGFIYDSSSHRFFSVKTWLR